MSLRFCSTEKQKIQKKFSVENEKIVDFNFWIEPGEESERPCTQALLLHHTFSKSGPLVANGLSKRWKVPWIGVIFWVLLKVYGFAISCGYEMDKWKFLIGCLYQEFSLLANSTIFLMAILGQHTP